MGYFILQGDVTKPDVWDELDELRSREFVSEVGEVMTIAATAIDTGYEAMRVYAYVRERTKVYAVKGDGDESGAARDIWPRKPSKNNKGKIDLYVVGVDTAKTGIYGRLRLAERGPGFVHFCDGLPDDYFDQLTCEWRKVVKTTNGREKRVWHKQPGARNEALDTMVYSLAALHAWLSPGRRLDKRVDARKPNAQTPKAAAAEAAPAKPRNSLRGDGIRGSGGRGYAGGGRTRGGW